LSILLFLSVFPSIYTESKLTILSQHFAKIKKNTSSGAGSSDEQQPSTPAKAAKPAKIKTKRANDQAIEPQGTKEESGEGLPSPTKKRRGRQPGTPAKSKAGEPKKRGKSASAAKVGGSEEQTGGKAEDESNASATHSDTGDGVELPM
jgi:hypothetical protein